MTKRTRCHTHIIAAGLAYTHTPTLTHLHTCDPTHLHSHACPPIITHTHTHCACMQARFQITDAQDRMRTSESEYACSIHCFDNKHAISRVQKKTRKRKHVHTHARAHTDVSKCTITYKHMHTQHARQEHNRGCDQAH